MPHCESLAQRHGARGVWEKDGAAVHVIAASFKRQRTTFNDGLKERPRLEESNPMQLRRWDNEA